MTRQLDLEFVTITDILNNFNVEFRGSRCRCPIHGGDNQTAFSFTDEVFQCFACGANGGKLDLVEALGEVDRSEALQIIAQIAGVDGAGNQSGQSTGSAIRIKPRKVDPAEQAIADRLADIEKLQVTFLERLQNLRRNRASGMCPSQRITFALLCEDTLEGLDGEHKVTKDQLRALKERNRHL